MRHDRICRQGNEFPMKKAKGIPKELLSLAGEHRVASELCKLGVFASITPGKRKQTDLYAIDDTTKRFVRIEVKASQSKSFLTGISQRKATSGYNPPEFWVLVSFARGGERFFVLENAAIEKLQGCVNDKWLEGYRARHAGKDYDLSKGVDSLPLESVAKADFENRRDQILAAVSGGTRPD
jgi:hypothetical protein